MVHMNLHVSEHCAPAFNKAFQMWLRTRMKTCIAVPSKWQAQHGHTGANKRKGSALTEVSSTM